MEAERSEAFEKLRPACVTLTKEHSRENVQEVTRRLKSVNDSVLQDLQEYVLFPLRFIFKQQLHPQSYLQEELLCDVSKCLEQVLTRTRVSRWEMFQDLFTCLTTCLSPPDGHGKVVSSEELKLALVKSLTALLKSADSSILQILYSAQSLPPLGHAVSLLLRLAETERSRDLQLAAMSCVLCLSQADSKNGGKLKLNYGNIFASFLPGVAMTLCRVVTGDSKQGHSVITRGVEVWWKVVCLVLGDSSLKQAQADKGTPKPSPVNEKLQGLLVKRTEEWTKMTSSKISVLVRLISTVKTHSNWRVRLALVEWADQLLNKCSGSLKESIPVLLEVLVSMIGDEYPNVSAQSREVLHTYKTRLTDSNQGRQLTEILEENLHALTTSLPRQIRMADEEEKLSAVNLLCGYLSLLGTNISSVLHSEPHLRRLSTALLQCVDLECRDIHIVEHRTTTPGYDMLETLDKTTRLRKDYLHFRDERIETALMKVCHLLGYYGDVVILTDHLFDMFHGSSVYKLPATLLLNETLQGVNTGREQLQDLQSETLPPAKPISTSHLQEVVRMLLEEYLSHFHNPNKSAHGKELSPLSSFHSQPKSVTSLNRDIMQMSLFLEGFGKFALVLGPEFEPLLIEVLYPLLEKLGDDNAYISSTAYSALVDICQACSYRSLDELIRQNADYLMNAISLRLRHLEANPDTPRVLQVMLTYCHADILPLIDDTVQEILCCLDDHYMEEAAMFMKVLFSLTEAVNRWFPSTNQKMDTGSLKDQEDTENTGAQDTPDTSQKTTAEEIREFFLDYHKQKQLAEGDFKDKDVEDEATDPTSQDNLGGPPADEAEDKKEIPKHVAAVKEVLTRSKHLLSSSSPRLRLLVLDTITQSCAALAPWRNELLPLLHQLWRPLVARFTDEEKLVTVKALQTLRSMCEVSGDFLRKRIFKEVGPILKLFLRKQAQISCGSAQAYLYTTSYKLQMACLSNLALICKLVGAQEIEVDGIVDSYLPYLSCRQPKPLQETSTGTFRGTKRGANFVPEAAIKGIKNLTVLEADVVWLKLCDLYTPEELHPSGPMFQGVKFLSTPGVKNEYTDNVVKLLPLTWNT